MCEAARLRRLSADLRHHAQWPRHQRGQRSERLSRPRHRLSREEGAAPRTGGIRDVLDREEVLRCEGEAREGRSTPDPVSHHGRGQRTATMPSEVVIGIGPAFGLKLFRTTAATGSPECCKAMMEASRARAARRASCASATRPTPRSWASRRAARRIGRGHRHPGQGHQRHPRARPPAPQQPRTVLQCADHRLAHYRGLGRNAAAYALGEMPEPVVVPTGEAMGARFHARVALIYAIETGA